MIIDAQKLNYIYQCIPSQQHCSSSHHGFDTILLFVPTLTSLSSTFWRHFAIIKVSTSPKSFFISTSQYPKLNRYASNSYLYLICYIMTFQKYSLPYRYCYCIQKKMFHKSVIKHDILHLIDGSHEPPGQYIFYTK